MQLLVRASVVRPVQVMLMLPAKMLVEGMTGAVIVPGIVGVRTVRAVEKVPRPASS